jgi:hypothetical protein
LCSWSKRNVDSFRLLLVLVPWSLFIMGSCTFLPSRLNNPATHPLGSKFHWSLLRNPFLFPNCFPSLFSPQPPLAGQFQHFSGPRRASHPPLGFCWASLVPGCIDISQVWGGDASEKELVKGLGRRIPHMANHQARLNVNGCVKWPGRRTGRMTVHAKI